MTCQNVQSGGEHLAIEPAENVPFWTPKQGGLTNIAGTAVKADPPLLFQPLRIRGLQLQNRLIVAPMAQYSCHDGHATPWHQQHLGSIAMRGPGLTWTEASAITKHGRTSLYDAGIWKESHVAAWRPVVEFVHSQGQKIGIQLVHCGRKGSLVPQWVSKGFDIMPKEAGGYADGPVAPSPIPYNDKFPPPKELTTDQIQEVITQWADAAERTVRAGFDAIELHGAHGYLIHQFLSPVSNKRTDRYGGSWENRARFLLEVLEAVRSRMSDRMPLFLRISATEWLEKSRPDLESWTNVDSIRLAKLLVGKIDAIDVSSGGIHADQKIDFEPWSETPGGTAHQAPFALAIKEAVGEDMIVNTVGHIRSGQAAEDLLQRGVDLVAVGKPFLKKPGLVFQFADVEVEMAIQHAYPYRGRGFAAGK